MTKRLIITIALGTIILFLWNALSWMALPFHSNTLNNLPKESINTQYLKENVLNDGVYHYPGLPSGNSNESLMDIQDKLKLGPRITLMVYKNGPSDLFNPGQFIGSLMINLLTVIFTVLLILKLKTKTLKSVLIHCIIIGLLIGLVSDVGQMNWYMFPLDYTLVNLFDHLIQFILLGILFGLYTFKEMKNVEE